MPPTTLVKHAACRYHEEEKLPRPDVTVSWVLDQRLEQKIEIGAKCAGRAWARSPDSRGLRQEKARPDADASAEEENRHFPFSR